MSTVDKTLRVLAALAFAGLLSACPNVTSVKDITADKAGYLPRKFSPRLLSPSVMKKLPVDGKASTFGQLKITTEAHTEHADGKKESWKSIITLTEAGNDIIQEMTEFSRNDISYGLYYDVSYKGILPLKWQRVWFNKRSADAVYEVKEITRMDAVPDSMGSNFTFEVASGIEHQVGNYSPYQKKCTIVRITPASDIHPDLPGQAVEAECKTLSNNIVHTITTYAMIQAYGVSIPLEHKFISKKTTYRIIDVDR